MFSRGVAAFLGAFTLLNVAGELIVRGFDANDWWIDLRPLPAPVATILLVAVGVVLLVFALRPKVNRTIRVASVAILTIAVCFAAANIAGFYRLLLRGQIH